MYVYSANYIHPHDVAQVSHLEAAEREASLRHQISGQSEEGQSNVPFFSVGFSHYDRRDSDRGGKS